MGKEEKKTFVPDTNVLLYDPRAIFHFGEHDVILLAIVIEEIDDFKEGHGDVHANAREFARILDDLTKKNNSTSRIPLGNGKGTLTIEEWDPSDRDLALSMFPVEKHDNLIIAATKRYLDKGLDVTLVSRDLMLRVKALNRKINAENYTHDSIKNVWALETEITKIDPDELCERDPEKSYYINQPLVTDTDPDSIYIWNGREPKFVATHACIIDKMRIKPRGVEQRFAMHVLGDPEIKAVAITGAAGSGKTLLSIAAALEQRKKGIYERIFVCRIPVTLGDMDMGALPGDLEAKNDPYFAPIRDACRVLMGESGISCSENQVKLWMEENGIEPVYISVIRGRTLNDAIVILDEAQNTNILEMKTFLTRPSETCKYVLVGDLNQIDRRWLSKESNGLSSVISAFRGERCFAHIHLPKSQRGLLAGLADRLL